MPGNMLLTDVYFPRFTENQSSDEKISQVTNYLYMMLEQLRYSMGNLGQENFNEAEFQSIVDIITKPVYLQLQDEKKNVSALQITAEQMYARIQSNTGQISEWSLVAGELLTRMNNAEGDILNVMGTANNLSAKLTSVEGNVTSLTATLTSMELSVSNGKTSSTIRLFANSAEISSQSISFSGLVSFTDLETEGKTTIHGGNITAGVINAVDINGVNVTGCTVRSTLEKGGGVSGEIQMCYLAEELLAGGIKLDRSGAGSETENRYRMFIYTQEVDDIAFAMKLESAQDISMEAERNIWMDAVKVQVDAGTINIQGGTVNITGTVMINGKEI